MTTAHMRRTAGALVLLLGAATAWAKPHSHEAQTGTAAYYSHVFEGRRTADHGHYHANRMTAASSTLPVGTRVRVTNLKNHRSVVVRVTDLYNDNNRVIDLSRAAAKKLGFLKAGTAQVRVQPL